MTTTVEVSDSTEEKIRKLQDEIEMKATVSGEDAGYTVPIDEEVTMDQAVEVSVTVVRHLLRRDTQGGRSILAELDDEMADTLNDRDIKHDM